MRMNTLDVIRRAAGLIVLAGLLAACAVTDVQSTADDAAMIAEAEAADLAAMRAQNSGDLEAFANYLSEDYAFCRRWRDLGGDIWADFEARLTHVGHTAYSGSLLQALQSGV